MAARVNEESLQPYYLFTLTMLVGRKAMNERTTVALGGEIKLRTAVVFVLASVLSLFLALILGFSFLGSYALLTPFVIVPPVMWFFTQQSKKGMQLSHIQRTFDSIDQPWAKGFVVYCGRLYKPGTTTMIHLTSANVPVEQSMPPTILDPFGNDVTLPTRSTPMSRAALAAGITRSHMATLAMDSIRRQESREWRETYENQLRKRMRKAEGAS